MILTMPEAGEIQTITTMTIKVIDSKDIHGFQGRLYIYNFTN